MDIKRNTVEVTLNLPHSVARILAEADLASLWDKNVSSKKLEDLQEQGLNTEDLAEYNVMVFQAVAAMYEQKDLGNGALNKVKFRPYELRDLYLTPIAATIISQLGNCKIGHYDIGVRANAEVSVDKKFMAKMSALIRQQQHLLGSQRGQINIKTDGTPSVMSSVIVMSHSDVDSGEVSLAVFNGENPDPKARLISACLGLQLKEASNFILYNGRTTEYIEPGAMLPLSSGIDSGTPYEDNE